MGFVKVFVKTASYLSWVFSRKDGSISLGRFWKSIKQTDMISDSENQD